MKIMHTLALASFTAALALSGAAFAVEASSTLSGMQDESGMATLGVDIRGVDASNMDSFMAGIPAESQASVKKGCETVVANQANQNPTVLGFCQALTGKM